MRLVKQTRLIAFGSKEEADSYVKIMTAMGWEILDAGINTNGENYAELVKWDKWYTDKPVKAVTR